MKIAKHQEKILEFLRGINQRRLLLGLSMLVGLLSGLAAVLLKNLTHFVESKSKSMLLGDHTSDLSFLLPLGGIFASMVFVKHILKQDIGHGVSKILFSISKRKGHLKPHNTWSSMLASSITVGLGGSVGLEAPITLTGSAIGSSIAHLLKLNYKSVVLLVGCGAAGAIAGIFKAPIAALIFAFEVLMLDLTAWSIVPLLIASVTAAIVSNFLMGEQVVFFFTLSETFVMRNLPFYVLLGVFTGLVSLYFTRMNNWVEGMMGKLKNGWMRTLSGGLLLCLLIFLMPQLFGEGYITLKTLLTGQSAALFNNTLFEGIIGNNSFFIVVFFMLLMLFKVVAMALTTGSGGVGGIFAPALFVGGMAGATLSKAVNLFSPANISENNFALVGMAGVMAGVMHAPLTAIFLIAEITGGYELFIPLIVTATLSYVTILAFESQSIYTLRLAQRGELMTHHKDKNILITLTLDDVLEKDFKKVNEEKELVGIISLDDVRDIIFQTELYDKTTIHEIMQRPPAVINSKEKMERVLELFEETGAWNLPVIEDGKYKGFISRSKIFSSYRKLLRELSDD